MFKVIIKTENNNRAKEHWQGRFVDSETAIAAAKDLASSEAWKDHIVCVVDISNGREIERYENLIRHISNGEITYLHPKTDNPAWYCKVVGCGEITDSKDDYCKDHQTPNPMLTLWDYECAINGQSACNATGLIKSMDDLRDKLWNNARQLGHGTEWVNHHPILQLYAYQLAHLCHGREPIEWEGYYSAMSFCKRVRDKEIEPNADYMLLNNYQ